MCAVLHISAVLDLAAECLPEGLIVLALILLQLEQLALDLLLQALGDRLEVAVVLEHLTRDVERQVGGVHHAAYKAEMVGQQVGAFVHDQHTVRVQLQALLIVLGVIVHRRMGRDEQHGSIGYRALDARVDMHERRLVIIELAGVERVIVLVLELLLGLLPDRHHRVERFVLDVLLPLGLVVVACVRRLLLHAGVGHIHLDRVADIVRILLDQRLDAVRLEEFVVILVIRVLLDGQGDPGAVFGLFAGRDGIASRAVRLPAVRVLAAERTGYDFHMACHHERCVKAYAELADDIHIVHVFVFLLEGQRA